MTSNSRHWAIAAAAFLAAAPVLAGCGAGSDAITNQPYSPTEATTAKVRGIDISQAFFLGPDSGSTLAAGGAAPLYLSLVNTNSEADTLVGLGVDPAVGAAKVAFPVELPADKRVAVGRPTPTIMVQGLKKPLHGGESIQVQLQFANAGVIPLTIPVITRSREYGTLPQAPEGGAPAAPANGTGTGAETGTETSTASTPSPSPTTSPGHAESGH
ncbi:hypothetical protein GCM10017673_36830 [Streptosporangium violaceochromogenes]|nr:hypothetical protein GCM10017673_36830 [Streptosporangium violaceochromogenes]